MTWDDKVELAKALNNADYDKVVIILQRNQDIDNQAADMFITGISMREEEVSKYRKYLDFFKEWISRYNFDSSFGLRTLMRVNLFLSLK